MSKSNTRTFQRVSPEEHLHALVATYTRIETELLALGSQLKEAAAEVLKAQRRPAPEYVPELRTLAQIGAEFWGEAYPKAHLQYHHAHAFCQKHGLLQGDGGRKNSFLVDRKQVLRLLAPKQGETQE